MSEISTNMVLDGITLALRAAYPDSKIESNNVMQGLKCPAFIVQLVTASQTVRGSNRWKRLPRFDILYFPIGDNEDCYTVADNLCEILEVINLPGGDKIRGTDMTFEVVDEVLHFLVSYNHFVYKDEDEIPMENLNIKQGGL